jgi:hypothetical protein
MMYENGSRALAARWTYHRIKAQTNQDIVHEPPKVFEDVQRCSKMFKGVQRCSKVFNDV